MKKYKIPLLVVLPGFITLIALALNQGKVSSDRIESPIFNSRLAGYVDRVTYDDHKLIPNWDFFIACKIKGLRSMDHTEDTTSAIFNAVIIKNDNPEIDLKIFEEIFISKNISIKTKNLPCISSTVVCRDSSKKLQYKIQFSF